MQVMEAWNVIGNDKVVAVSGWVGNVWEFIDVVLCVTVTCWKVVISMYRQRSVCKMAPNTEIFIHIHLGEQLKTWGTVKREQTPSAW